MTTCNCLNEIRNNWINATKDKKYRVTSARFILSTIIDNQHPEYGHMTGQHVELAYIYIGRDGKPKRKAEKTFVTHRFCPFCGRDYEKGDHK